MRKVLLLTLMVLMFTAWSNSSHAAEQFTFGGLSLSSTPQDILNKGMSDDYQNISTSIAPTNQISKARQNRAGGRIFGLSDAGGLLEKELSLSSSDTWNSEFKHQTVSRNNEHFSVDMIYLEGVGQQHGLGAYFVTMPGYDKKMFYIRVKGKILQEAESIYRERYGSGKRAEGNSEIWKNDNEIAILKISLHDSSDSWLAIINKEAYAKYAKYITSELGRIEAEEKARKEADEKKQKEVMRSKI